MYSNSKLIFVVDDSEIDRNLSKMMLEKNGHRVTTIEDHEFLIGRIESESPDLILLDIMMPNINGNELLVQIRKKWRQIDLPVIMISSRSESQDVLESFRLGANDYVTKPVEYDIALRRIQTHLDITNFSKKMLAMAIEEKNNILKQSHDYNTTIKTLLSTIKEKENEIHEQYQEKISQNILPLLKHLKAGKKPSQSQLEHLERHLKNLIPSHTVKHIATEYRLTLTEVKVVKLIKDELPSKLVAEELGVSIFTVNNHILHIRKKLNLPRTTNLKSFLQTVEI